MAGRVAVAVLALAASAAGAQEAGRHAPDSPPRRATPANAPQDWVNSDDYPREARRQGKQGTVGFRLTIGPDGKPSACRILGSSGTVQLDVEVCRLMMERARFHPALDAKGNPTADEWVSRFRWELPKAGIGAAMAFNLRLTVGAGTMLSCVSATFGAMPTEAGEALCANFRRVPKERLTALGGTAGRPVTVFLGFDMTLDGKRSGGDLLVPPGFVPAIMLEERYEITPEGKAENCTMRVNGSEAPLRDRCGTGEEFDGDGTRHSVETSALAATDGDPAILLDLLQSMGGMEGLE